ncbi:MAG: nitrite reductase small subunit NirD [Halopseudomonas sp.]
MTHTNSQINSQTMHSASAANAAWRPLCARQDLVANSGVVALLDDAQVALFHLPQTSEGEQVFAIENRDPKSGANVIGRGIVGHLKGDLVIASPLYKQHFRLADGSCVEYPEQRLRVWPVRLNGDLVEVGLQAD